jgi:hypothetical protein
MLAALAPHVAKNVIGASPEFQLITGDLMDFIESLFHVSPDDGSGSLEVMILNALCATLIMLAVALIRVRAGKRRSQPRSAAALNASARPLSSRSASMN